MAYEQIAVYIMTNKPAGTLYIGVTSSLTNRIHQHREGIVEGFTKQYGLHQLAYYELHQSMEAAIRREKRLKKYRREEKIKLIQQMNPQWNDLWHEIIR